jgi:2-oxoglutarate ferredoxin oxidoreductase subunit beta
METAQTKITANDLGTACPNTWCPGCGNFGIEIAVKKAFAEMIEEGKFKREELAVVAGIGCHGKIADYLNVNTFYGLHGRSLAAATGIKLARPELTVVDLAGDGDAYGEGLEHLIFAAKRNIDLTLIVHDNRVYALTVGQASPTSPQNFKGKSTPQGSPDKPINPLELMLVAGATFVGRAFSGDAEYLREIIKKAVNHKGFSIVEVLQPCFTFFNTFEYYKKNCYHLEDGRVLSDKEDAREKAREWDYSESENPKIPLGIFYQSDQPVFDGKPEA